MYPDLGCLELGLYVQSGGIVLMGKGLGMGLPGVAEWGQSQAITAIFWAQIKPQIKR
jgi:hypothetical protein